MLLHRSLTRLIQVLTVVSLAFAGSVCGSVVASADASLSIPVMGQQDPGWAGAPLGTSPTDTIGSSGCAITSVTMMLRYYGINTDPGAFNAWLTANNGYAFDDAIVWDAVTNYTGGRVAFSGWLGADLGTITTELDAGRPVVAEVRLDGNQHFVLLTGYGQDGGFVINDPWFGDSVNFADRYGDPSAGVVSIRTFMPADPGGPSHGGRVSWLANATGAVHVAQ